MHQKHLKRLTPEEHERLFFLGECLIVNGEFVVGFHNQDLWQEFNTLTKKNTTKVIVETGPYDHYIMRKK